MKTFRITYFHFLAASILLSGALSGQSRFQDKTATAGITHQYAGHLYGGGAACGDFDDDGYLDLFVPNGQGVPNFLYHNNGDGTFSEIAADVGLADLPAGMGSACGDIDNDGDLDIYLVNFNAANTLYLNDGTGTFNAVTAGVEDDGPGSSVALADYNNDGWLDIYTLNHSTVRSSILYRNNGDGTFSDVTEETQTTVVGKSLGVAFFDYDNDGDQDLIVVDEFETDHLFRNNGDGSFSDVSSEAGMISSDGMGIDFSDFDHDGDLDMYIGDFFFDPLLRNNGDGTFTNIASDAGISNDGIGWGVNFMDYDNDGDQDLYVINGSMMFLGPEKANVFYENIGGSFQEKGESFGTMHLLEGRGSVSADFDRDGYQDLLFIGTMRSDSRLLTNQGGSNHWLSIKLIGTVSNRSGIGARVEVQAGATLQIDEMRSGSSYASMQPLELEFGLGQHTIAEKITVTWPSGIIQRLNNVSADQIITITEPSINDFESSNLPIVMIETNGQEIPQDNKITAEMFVIDNGPDARNFLNDPPNNYSGLIGIEIRGSSSTSWPKKQYGFETRDELGSNLNVPLMGLPPENDWILNAPYIDKSLSRNALIYNLSNQLGMYASRTKHCEVFLNGEYQGIYILMEKIKRDNNRVDIATLNPDEISGDDLTGGYIIKVDKPGDDGFTSLYPPFPGATQQVLYQFHYPKDDDIVPEQSSYIQNFMYNFENVMNSENYSDPVTGYPSIINIDSFLDFIILNEISKNVDGYRLSTFMHKNKDSNDGRLTMGPIWDFNLAFGNANYYDAEDTDDWILAQLQEDPGARGDFFQLPFWWRRLLQDSAFTTLLQSRWWELRNTLLSQEHTESVIDSFAVLLEESQSRNFDIWAGPGVSGGGFWPVPSIFYTFETYADEIAYLKLWLAERMTWIDENIDQLPVSSLGINVSGEIPSSFIIHPNFPDPFNGETTIRYDIPRGGNISVAIYNIAGEKIITLDNGFESSGEKTTTWDGRDGRGIPVSSGLYFLTIRLDTEVKSEKILYLK